MKDLYAAWSGASAAWQQLELLSSNVANAETQGYREQRPSFDLAGSMPRLAGVRASTADGALHTDGVPTHLAIRGDAFFALADGTFTRDGGFRMDGEGRVMSADGTPLLTDVGPLQLDPKETFSVAPDGLVTGSLSGEVGRVALVKLADGRPVGGNRWTGTGVVSTEATLVQGAREGSNVDTMRSMVELIEASRFFEATEKAMQTSDEMRQRLNTMQE